MILSMIASMDENGGIGKDNRLPWHLPDDLRRFKAITMGHHLIMGRRTWDSLGRPLPGRTNIVISHNPAFQLQGGLRAHSFEQALAVASERGETEVFIIGGAQVFAQALPLAEQLYLTRVHACLDTDIFFPPLPPGEWLEVECSFHPADERHAYSFSYQVIRRKP